MGSLEDRHHSRYGNAGPLSDRPNLRNLPAVQAFPNLLVGFAVLLVGLIALIAIATVTQIPFLAVCVRVGRYGASSHRAGCALTHASVGFSLQNEPSLFVSAHFQNAEYGAPVVLLTPAAFTVQGTP